MGREQCSGRGALMVCLFGCVVPVYAFAKAMNALLGFGTLCRRHAVVVMTLPIVAWVGVAMLTREEWGETLPQGIANLCLALGVQLLAAAVVSLTAFAGLRIAAAVRRR